MQFQLDTCCVVSAPLYGSDGGETAGFLNRSKTFSMLALVAVLPQFLRTSKKFFRSTKITNCPKTPGFFFRAFLPC